MVDDFGTAQGLDRNVIADMQVVLDEVLTNIVRYGYGDDRVHEIHVRLTVRPDVFEAEIEDDGKPFNPLTVDPPDRISPLRERRVGGLGIHFVKSLMTEVRYARVDNHNRLVLTRRLAHERGGGIRGDA